MLGDILHFHRTEGAKADMQGYMGDLYTCLLYTSGITHNREFEEGALRIEFYEEQAGILARKVLKDHGYTIPVSYTHLI